MMINSNLIKAVCLTVNKGTESSVLSGQGVVLSNCSSIFLQSIHVRLT
jgi:hypothetical protein